MTVTINSAHYHNKPVVQGAHRFWRVSVISTYGGAYYRIGEIAFRTTPGGSSVTTSGTAIAFNEYSPASRAFDGLLVANVNDHAGFMGSTQHWVGWDFGLGNSQAIVECQVWNSDTTSEAELDQHAQEYEVQWSDDGVVWSQVAYQYAHPRDASLSTTNAWI